MYAFWPATGMAYVQNANVSILRFVVFFCGVLIQLSQLIYAVDAVDAQHQDQGLRARNIQEL